MIAMQFTPLVSVIAAACSAFYLVRHMYSRRSISLLLSREPLSDDEVFVTFFSSSNFDKASVTRLWNIIADTLEVPANRMRPTDVFGKEIGVDILTNERMETLQEIAASEAARLGRGINLNNINTADDFIRALAPSSHA